MKKNLIIMTFLFSALIFGQVGINTPNAAATLDVVAKRTDGTTSEGIIAPRLTGDQIKSADARYTAPQTGTFVYATNAVNGATAKTVNITAPGYYYFDGVIWQKMGADKTAFTGDIKHSARLTDHGGWYLLNGRAISTLPAAAQAAATALGFTGNIPDARDRVLKTKTAAENIGDKGGVSTLKILRANLPAINFTGGLTGSMDLAGEHQHRTQGNTANGGQHNHNVVGTTTANGEHRHTPHEASTPRAGNSGAALFLFGNSTLGNNHTGNYNGNWSNPSAWGGVGAATTTAPAGNHRHNLDGTAQAAGAHNHTINILTTENGGHRHSLANVDANVATGGSGTELDNRAPYLVVNTYIYLGE